MKFISSSFKGRAPFHYGVRIRLLLWGLAILLFVLAVFSGIVYFRQVEYQKVVLGNRILAEANLILETYRVWYTSTGGREGMNLYSALPDLQWIGSKKPPAQAQLLKKQIGSEESVIQTDEVLLMFDPENRIVGRAGNLDDTDVANLSQIAPEWRIEAPLFFTFKLMSLAAGQPPVVYYFTSATTSLNPTNQTVFMLLGAPIDPDGQLPRLLWNLVLASLIILVISMLGGYWLAGMLLQPMQAITRTAKEINAYDLTRRLNLGKQDELGELADTFDRMLDRLENAFERQRQFTADASHDLRTPLTIVNLEVNRILEDPRTHPGLYPLLGVIRDENERMTHLVNNLMMLARADVGSLSLKYEVLDFSELTLDVVEHLIPLSQRNAVTISTGEMSPVTVRGDRFYLSQLVTNLVENAVKHGAGEERKVWIETGCRGDSFERMGWVRVEDHGSGIAAEHLSHLFDRFYRIDASRSEDEMNGSNVPVSSDGHGLGLSIVKWVAEAHGGSVQVTSQVGKGTIFKVLLPLFDLPESAEGK